MTETFAALLFAHVIADFLLQTNWMVRGKTRLLPLFAHIAVVLVAAFAATGTLHPVILVLAAAHLLIDALKSGYFSGKLGPFLLDQAAHLATLMVAAQLAPDLWAGGLWSGILPLPALMALAAGAILATQAGGFAVGILMQPWLTAAPEGLPNGGRMIGILERGLIFLLILTGLAAGIGFLIAAKSLLRFGAVKDEGRLSEYVIIGTLASFGWAIAMSSATIGLLALLRPLGIPDLSP